MIFVGLAVATPAHGERPGAGMGRKVSLVKPVDRNIGLRFATKQIADLKGRHIERGWGEVEEREEERRRRSQRLGKATIDWGNWRIGDPLRHTISRATLLYNR